MTLIQARNSLPDAHNYWYSSKDLGVGGDWKDAWDTFMRSLEICGIRLNDQMDSLIWDFKKSDGIVSAKLVYECIILTYSPPIGSIIFAFIWKRNLPKKICCFIWLALMNKLLSWDNLQKRRWKGPSICALCGMDAESVGHLFYRCSVWKNVFSILKE